MVIAGSWESSSKAPSPPRKMRWRAACSIPPMSDFAHYLSFISGEPFPKRKRAILHWISIVVLLSLISLLCGFFLGSVITQSFFEVCIQAPTCSAPSVPVAQEKDRRRERGPHFFFTLSNIEHYKFGAYATISGIVGTQAIGR